MKSVRAGFTLVELSLSMIFIGILSISVVLIINNTVAAYRRGMTLNHINTVGMDLTDDIRSAVQNGSARSIVADCTTYYANSSTQRTDCEADGADKFVTITNLDTFTESAAVIKTEDGQEIKDVPVWGAFCSGTYSYIWNSGYFVGYDGDGERGVSGATRATLTYKTADGALTVYGSSNDGLVYSPDVESQPFRILKVRDDTRAVCVSTVRPYKNNAYRDGVYAVDNEFSGNFDISNGYGTVAETPVDLILADEYNDLVLYDFEIAKPAESTTRSNTFYAGSFILGTIWGGINILATGKSCETPMNYEYENFDYCAINKFNFAVQAGGEAGYGR